MPYGINKLPASNSYYTMLRRSKRRGIPICRRWRTSFKHFFADMGARPKGTVLDRIKNKKGYNPKNCRWATYQLSTENRGITVWIKHGGKKWRVKEFATETQLPEWLIYRRTLEGWTAKRIITQYANPAK